MPRPKHKCAHENCDKLISAVSTHCRNHVPHTSDWVNRQAKSQIGKVLSTEHRQKISAAKAGKVETVCQWCGKTFMVIPSRLHKGQGKHCSNACTYAARAGENSPLWNGGTKEYTCQLCGRGFERHECYVNGETIACSYSCSSILKKAKQQNTSTNIERIMAQALTDAGVRFEEQKTLCSITIADFYLPDSNIAIFCDGDYWHNYPYGKPRDKNQTQTLQDNGITVLRFWGSEIESSIALCLDRINQYRLDSNGVKVTLD